MTSEVVSSVGAGHLSSGSGRRAPGGTSFDEGRPKILLLDDDPVFRSLLVSLARDNGLDIEAYGSLQEVDPFLRMNLFAGAILDYHLLESDVPQLITGIESFFTSIPTLLVSADEGARTVVTSNRNSPFRAFVSKLKGGQAILKTMRKLIGRGKR